MAKKPPQNSGTSRVRFIMLEAEIPEGDLTQITTAIQNALKPASVAMPRAPKQTVQVLTSSEAEADADTSSEEFEAENYVDEVTPARTSAPRNRKPVSRTVLEIDLEGENPFADFVESYPPETERDKHLVSVAYFCEQRKEITDISADHVYTCFRKMKWSVGSKDFAQPLRDLKRLQLLTAGPSRGTYVINHIGLDHVHKLAGD